MDEWTWFFHVISCGACVCFQQLVWREEETKMAKRDAEETEYKGEAKEQQETVSEQEVACDAST